MSFYMRLKYGYGAGTMYLVFVVNDLKAQANDTENVNKLISEVNERFHNATKTKDK